MNFYIDTKKRTVVAKMNSEDIYEQVIAHLANPIDKIYRYKTNEDSIVLSCGDGLHAYSSNQVIKELLVPIVMKKMKSYYVGKAKCAPTDTFDEEKGKEIARARLLAQYYFDLMKCIHEVDNMVNTIGSCVFKIFMKNCDTYCKWCYEATKNI